MPISIYGELHKQLTENAVKVEDNKFQAHPESYEPRIFVYVEEQGMVPCYYELLKTGQAIPWTAKPTGFDYWELYCESVHDINVRRNG